MHSSAAVSCAPNDIAWSRPWRACAVVWAFFFAKRLDLQAWDAHRHTSACDAATLFAQAWAHPWAAARMLSQWQLCVCQPGRPAGHAKAHDAWDARARDVRAACLSDARVHTILHGAVETERHLRHLANRLPMGFAGLGEGPEAWGRPCRGHTRRARSPGGAI